MIASLGMYVRAETASANDRLWSLIREGLRARGLPAPEALTRGEAAYWPAWQSPDLVLSQTCGYPYRTALHGHVTLIGTPDYGLPDCPPGHYCSVLVARADDDRALPDFRSARFAFNEGLSQSGWAAPQTHAAGLGFAFPASLQTGGHRASALAVAEGRADIASLDAVTWGLIQTHEPFATALREVARTRPTPGLPLIAAPQAEGEATFAAVADAIERLAPADRAALRLRGIVRIPASAYLAVPNPAPPGHSAAPI